MTCTEQHKEKLGQNPNSSTSNMLWGNEKHCECITAGGMWRDATRTPSTESSASNMREKISKHTDNHPTRDILTETWNSNIERIKKRATFIKSIDQHVDETTTAEKMTIHETPPWKQLRIEDEHRPSTSQINKSTTSEEEMKAMHRQAHIWEHGRDKVHDLHGWIQG